MSRGRSWIALVALVGALAIGPPASEAAGGLVVFSYPTPSGHTATATATDKGKVLKVISKSTNSTDFTPDGKTLINTGNRGLYSFDVRSGRSKQILATDPGETFADAEAGDNAIVFVDETEKGPSLQLIDLQGGSRQTIVDDADFDDLFHNSALELLGLEAPHLTPDGKEITFVADDAETTLYGTGANESGIYDIDVESGRLLQAVGLDDGEQVGGLDLSADGKTIAFTLAEQDGTSLHYARFGDLHDHSVDLPAKRAKECPVLSPNAKQALVSEPAGGQAPINRVTLKSGKASLFIGRLSTPLCAEDWVAVGHGGH